MMYGKPAKGSGATMRQEGAKGAPAAKTAKTVKKPKKGKNNGSGR